MPDREITSHHVITVLLDRHVAERERERKGYRYVPVSLKRLHFEQMYPEIVDDSSSDSASSSDDDSDTSSSYSSDSEPVTQEYLDSLLEKARNNALSVSEEPTNSVDILEGDVVQLDIEPKYVCLFLHCVKF